MVLTPDEILTGGPGSATIDFASASGVALMVSAVVLAAIYVYAAFFRSTQLTGYVKQELYELFISALIVMFIAGAVASMITIKVGGVLPSDLIPEDDHVDSRTTIYQAAGRYYDRVGEDMAKWLNMNYWISMYIDQIASVTPYARPLGVGLVASPMAGLASPIKQLLYQMSTALAVAFIINAAQKFVYLFSLHGFLHYYLPAGIFFRTFTPTRRLGGALIGVALTFLFVLPALTMVSFSMFYHENGPLITFGAMADQYFGDATGSFWQRFETFYDTNFTAISTSVTSLFSGVFGGIGQVFEELIGDVFLSLMLFPISVISYAFAIGFVIPAFNILILISTAKSLSRSFGEEIDIGSLTRLV